MKPLNDLFISHDAIGILQAYLLQADLKLPEFELKLNKLGQRNGISFSIWWQLLDELNGLINQPALGSFIGASSSPKQSGILGYLTQTSATLLNAMQCFERFQPLLYAGDHAQLSWHGKLCTLTWSTTHAHSTQISDEVVVASLLSIMRHCLQDQQLALESVSFIGTPMADANLYRQLYGCDVLFGQGCISLSFAGHFLLQPISSSDSGLHNLLVEQAQNKLPNDAHLSSAPVVPASLAELQSSLQPAFVRALHEGKPTAEHIARKLNISSRTLHRRLKSGGVVFKELLKDIRKQLAKEYLSEDHLSLTEVALLLGYSEQSAFSRAFMDWYAQSPSQFKRAYLGR